MASSAFLSPLRIHELRTEQDAVLNQMKGSPKGATNQPDIGGGALAGSSPGYESPQWEKMSIAALHARTDAISRELSEHKGILEQMQTPKARTDARNQFVEGKVREVSSAVRFQSSSPHLAGAAESSQGTTRLQSSTVSVDDAYAVLLSELKEVREQVSRFADSNDEESDVSSHAGDRYQRHQHRRRGFGRADRRSFSSSSSSSAAPPPPESDSEVDIDSMRQAHALVNSEDILNERKRSLRRRGEAMQLYADRIIEERERMLDDIQERLMREERRGGSAHVVLKSKIGAQDVQRVHRRGRSSRRKKFQTAADDVFARVHNIIRKMRDDLKQEEQKSVRDLREAFEEDKKRIIGEMEQRCRDAKQEMVARAVENLDAEKRTALETHRKAMELDLAAETKRMRDLLHAEHAPALQTLRTGELQARQMKLAEEREKLEKKLEGELSILKSKLEDETLKAIDLQRARMIEDHRRRAEHLTQEILHKHEADLRKDREELIRSHQDEQERTLADLAEALAFGVKEALSEQAEALRKETERKAEALRHEAAMRQAEAIDELQAKMGEESRAQLNHIESSAQSELEIQLERIRADKKAEHAARVHKLQLDNASRKAASLRKAELEAEQLELERVDSMESALQADIDDSVDRLKQRLNEQLQVALVERRKEGEARRRQALEGARKAFEKEAADMMRFVDKFFSGAVGDSEPSSPEASLKHMPTSKRAIQSRLKTLTHRYELHSQRFEGTAEALSQLQDENLELKRDLNAARRELQRARKHERSRAGAREDVGSLTSTARELYAANSELMQKVLSGKGGKKWRKAKAKSSSSS